MPAARAPHSKKQVNRAGRLVSDWVYSDQDRQLAGVPATLMESIEIIQWWRSLHARPLGKVNAGLRYYIKVLRSRRGRRDAALVRDYVGHPKADGYRAVHIVVHKDGCRIEVQLRTPWQDSWAQSVEQDTRRLRAGLKFGAGPADLREYYRAVSEYFTMRELNVVPSEEFMEDLAKLYEATRVYFADQPGN